MSRLHKKCMIVSATTHALLVSLLFISPAFIPREKPPEAVPILTIIPSKLIDEPFAGGGGSTGPAAKPAEILPPAPEPLRPEPPVVKPEPEPTPPQPRRIEPEKATVPPKNTPKDPEPKPSQPDPASKEKPTKHEIKPSFTKAPPNSTSQKPSDAKARAIEESAKAKARAEAISKLTENLKRGLSAGTGVEMPEFGSGGGEAYANWHWAVVKIFDDAWYPDDVPDNNATVRVSVTILRNGTVQSYKLLQKSGDPALDASVLSALKRVRTVPAFPEGAKDYERTLKLNFNLKSKRFSG